MLETGNTHLFRIYYYENNKDQKKKEKKHTGPTSFCNKK